ncbi:MAG: DUF4832 domain-containing protein [Treponema sp.]|nr:DUF4832 domain-containing protein [Treponema sp.]
MKKKLFFFSLLLTVFFLSCCSKESNDELSNQDEENFEGKAYYLQVDEANALKGFFPFETSTNTAIPTSMEFFYIPLNDIWKTEDSFDFSLLEEKIENIKNRGHQVVFRVYLDYPELKDKADGTPTFFWDAGIEKIYYTNPDTGNQFFFPDYTNQKCIDFLSTFIEKLGQEYNGDPRIAYIFCGLVGHWGEWHNYYYTQTKGHDGEKMPDDEQQRQLYKAYSESFTKTFTLTRYPTSDCLQDYTNIGFHDDSFTEDTIDDSKSWFFMSRLKEKNQTERWKLAPIGGEFRPENQVPFLNGKKYKAYYQDYDECCELTHTSSLIYDAAFYGNRTSAQRKIAWQASKKLGYDLYCSKSQFYFSEDKSKLIVNISISNKGLAPFYYNWKPLLILLDEKNNQICQWEKPFDDWNLPKILPEEKRNYKAELELPSEKISSDINLDNTKILLGIQNPMEGGIPLKLANSSLNLDKDGFISLWNEE